MKQKLYTLLLSFFAIALNAQTTITDADIEAGGTLELSKDVTYLLDGYVFVEDGATIKIEAGTVIKGANSPSNGDAASALIISQGGRIEAEGTADEPIIFTAELDDVENDADLTAENKGLWGGVIILGKATVGVNGGVINVEGIPSTEGRAQYGGTEDDDNSGIFKYVSIRHGGAKLEANNEINGLTLAGVGSATEIDYVEVFANLDDGIEWFGGTVNVNHAVVSFCGDDSYDYDQSWNGKGQFWFTIQDALSNRAGEWDGSEATDLGPKVSPKLANLTFIGSGADETNENGNDAIVLKDDAAVQIYNSIFTDFSDGAITLDPDSYDRFLSGDITFENNIFFEFGNGSEFSAVVETESVAADLVVTALVENSNQIADPEIAGISRQPDGGLDPRVNGSGAAYAAGVEIDDDYFENTAYLGAFGNENWAEGWTALSANGYFGNLQSSVNDLAGFVEGKTLKVYPNPAFTDVVNIQLDLEETKTLSVEISDMNGRVVKSVSSKQNYVPGKYLLDVNVAQLPNGYYTVNVIADKGIFSNKLIISK